jgi:hypothetical protein
VKQRGKNLRRKKIRFSLENKMKNNINSNSNVNYIFKVKYRMRAGEEKEKSKEILGRKKNDKQIERIGRLSKRPI